MNKINEVTPLRVGYVNKVLPLVYDDSLSYYELLCKVVNKINEIIALISGNIKELFDQYFNEIMIDAIYDEETETITLKKELIVGDGVHRYDANSNSMVIGD